MQGRLSIFKDAVTELLEPSETPLALQAATYPMGHEETVDKPAPKPDLSVVDMALGLPTAYTLSITDKLVGGVSYCGWSGSMADGLRDALRANDDLLLTNERLIVVKGIGTPDARITWSEPRNKILKLERAARFGQAGRLWLLLEDGSALAVVLGYFSSGGAKRLVEAWNSTTTNTKRVAH